MNDIIEIGYCGVCCSHCGMQTRVPKIAGELERFVEAYRYGEWIGHVTRAFEFANFLKGLEWFAESACKGCLQGGGMPNCEVRTCCRGKGLKNCYFCKGFQKCEKLGYQKETYRVHENHARIGQIGYEGWVKEQEEKAKADFDNIVFLEKKSQK